MYCPNCGGHIEGDGYTIPFNCENVDISELTIEHDSGIIYCNSKE